MNIIIATYTYIALLKRKQLYVLLFLLYDVINNIM